MNKIILALVILSSTASLADLPIQSSQLICVSAGNDINDLSSKMGYALRQAKIQGFTVVSAPTMTYRQGETVVCVIVSK